MNLLHVCNVTTPHERNLQPAAFLPRPVNAVDPDKIDARVQGFTSKNMRMELSETSLFPSGTSRLNSTVALPNPDM